MTIAWELLGEQGSDIVDSWCRLRWNLVLDLLLPRLFSTMFMSMKYDQMIQMGWLHQNSLVLVRGEDRPKCPQQNLIVFFNLKHPSIARGRLKFQVKGKLC